MEKTNHELLNKLFEIVETDFDQVLTEIEQRNEKQLAEMEIIKNMVNECIRELFENFEIDIEDNYVERKSSLSSKVQNFFTENQEKLIVEEKPKETPISNKKKAKMSVPHRDEKISSEKAIKNTEKNTEKDDPSVKSDTKNNEENLAHDISFSINQSHEVKNGTNPSKDQMTVEIISHKKDEEEMEKAEKKTRNPTKSPEFEKKNENSHSKKKEEKGRNIQEKNKKHEDKLQIEEKQHKIKEEEKKKHEKHEKPEKPNNHDKKTPDAIKNIKSSRNENPEKVEKIMEKKGSFDPENTEKRSVAESDKKQKNLRMKEKAFRSYIAPHSATSKTIQELINNSSCKKSSLLNESNPPTQISKKSEELNKKSEETRKKSIQSNSEQAVEKNVKTEVLLEKNMKSEALLPKKEEIIVEKKENQISHNRNKSEDMLLKKKDENSNIKNQESNKKKEEMENRSEDRFVSKKEYSSERNRELTPNKRNPMMQNKFLNYYYFFDDQKEK